MINKVLNVNDTTIAVIDKKGVFALFNTIMQEYDLLFYTNAQGVIAIQFNHYPSYRKIISNELAKHDLKWLKEIIDDEECLLFVLMQL